MAETNTRKITNKEIMSYPYPLNLILAISDCGIEELPMEVSRDTHSGLIHALTTLSPREERVLEMRYKDNRTRAEIGEEFCISDSRTAQIEHRALRKLRNPVRYTFIKHGLMGWMQKHCEAEYQRGLTEGKTIGYKQCLEDVEKGKTSEGYDVDLISTRFEEMELSVRSANCMRAKGYEKVADIMGLTDYQITRIRNLGKKSIAEVAGALKRLGVTGTEWDKYM